MWKIEDIPVIILFITSIGFWMWGIFNSRRFYLASGIVALFFSCAGAMAAYSSRGFEVIGGWIIAFGLVTRLSASFVSKENVVTGKHLDLLGDLSILAGFLVSLIL